MSTAPEAPTAERSRPLTTQEQLAALLGPATAAPPPAADTRAAQDAQAAAEGALRAHGAASAALERDYAAAVENTDVTAMQELAEQRAAQLRERLGLSVAVSKAVAHVYGLQARDAQAAVDPLRLWAGRAQEIAREKQAVAALAEQQAHMAVGRAQQAQMAVSTLNERWAHAEQAVRATTARLSEQLGAPVPTERGRAP